MYSKLSKFLILFFALALPVMPAHAQDQPQPPPLTPAQAKAQAQSVASLPVPPTLANIAEALLRLGEITLEKDETVDEFARIAYCDIYEHYFKDEFQWRRVRAALRKSVQIHINSYPLQFRMERVENFVAYDFNHNKLPLAEDSIMHKTVYLELLKLPDDPICGADLKIFPKFYVAVLDKPLQFDGVPMAENDAHMLVEKLKKTDKGREAYGRYVITLRPQVKILSPPGDLRRANIATHLDQIIFYQDPSFIKSFYSATGDETTPLGTIPSLDQIPFEGITQMKMPPPPMQTLPVLPQATP